MKTQTPIKVVVVCFIILLCIGFAFLFSPYNKSFPDRDAKDLYCLVPSSANAVLEVSDLSSLRIDIKQMNNDEV